jgi:hypothetical protein
MSALQRRAAKRIGASEPNVTTRLVEAEIGRFGSLSVTNGVGTSVPEEVVVYIAAYGNDANDGSSRQMAVATLGRAYELVARTGWNRTAKIHVVSTASASDAPGESSATVELVVESPPQVGLFTTPTGAPGGVRSPLVITGDTEELYAETSAIGNAALSGGSADTTLGTFSLMTLTLQTPPAVALERGDWVEIAFQGLAPGVTYYSTYMVWAHTPGSALVTLATTERASMNLSITSLSAGDTIRIYRTLSTLTASNVAFFKSGELSLLDIRLRNEIPAGIAPQRFVSFVSISILLLSAVTLELTSGGQEFFFNDIGSLFWGGNFLTELQNLSDTTVSGPVYVVSNVDDPAMTLVGSDSSPNAPPRLNINESTILTQDFITSGPIVVRGNSSLLSASLICHGMRGNVGSPDGIQLFEWRPSESNSDLYYIYSEGGTLAPEYGERALFRFDGSIRIRGCIALETLHEADVAALLYLITTRDSRSTLEVQDGIFNLSGAAVTDRTCYCVISMGTFGQVSLPSLPLVNRLDGTAGTVAYAGGFANYGDGIVTDPTFFQHIGLPA